METATKVKFNTKDTSFYVDRKCEEQLLSIMMLCQKMSPARVTRSAVLRHSVEVLYKQLLHSHKHDPEHVVETINSINARRVAQL